MMKCNKSRRKEPISPWITKGLLKSINKKNKLHKQYIHSPTVEKLQHFKTYKNKLNMLIRKAKRKYFFRKFESSKNNMKLGIQSTIFLDVDNGKLVRINSRMIMEIFSAIRKMYQINLMIFLLMSARSLHLKSQTHIRNTMTILEIQKIAVYS